MNERQQPNNDRFENAPLLYDGQTDKAIWLRAPYFTHTRTTPAHIAERGGASGARWGGGGH